MHFYDLEANVISLVYLALTVVKLWALVDAITRPAAAFPAADKQTKAFWIWLLAAFFVAHVLFQSVFGILSLIGTIAAFVYLLDVKPALVSVTRRR